MHQNQLHPRGKITGRKAYVAAVLLCMTSINGGAEALDCDPAPKMLLQYFHMNAAWGFQFQGVYLDTCGNFGKYAINLDNFEELAASIPATGVIEAFVFRGLVWKYAKDFSQPVRTLPASELERINQLLVIARQGEIQELQSCAYDAGRFVLFAFESTKGSDVYRMRTLKEEGDFCMNNSSAEAGALFKMMQKEVGGTASPWQGKSDTRITPTESADKGNASTDPARP